MFLITVFLCISLVRDDEDDEWWVEDILNSSKLTDVYQCKTLNEDTATTELIQRLREELQSKEREKENELQALREEKQQVLQEKESENRQTLQEKEKENRQALQKKERELQERINYLKRRKENGINARTQFIFYNKRWPKDRMITG